MRFPVLAGIFLGLATPVLAAPDTWICHVANGKSGTWIAPQIVILHDPAARLVVVNDEVTLNFGGKPVAGEVKVDNDRRITFGWTVREIQAVGGGKAMRMAYRATIQKEGHAFSVQAAPHGYSNSFEGRGSCVRK